MPEEARWSDDICETNLTHTYTSAKVFLNTIVKTEVLKQNKDSCLMTDDPNLERNYNILSHIKFERPNIMINIKLISRKIVEN